MPDEQKEHISADEALGAEAPEVDEVTTADAGAKEPRAAFSQPVGRTSRSPAATSPPTQHWWNKLFQGSEESAYEDAALEEARQSKKRATNFLIRAIGLTEFLILAALVIGLFVFKDTFTVYTGTAITLVMIWIALLIPYLAWAIYFFNINFGLTNEDWAEIRKFKADLLEKEDIYELILYDPDRASKLEETMLSLRGLKIPHFNPHREETMGLPPGTIRGTLALTVSIGGLAMFIASLGMDSNLAVNNFFIDNLEFFKTAFLMVIAFYFGNKSLEILQRDKKGPVYGGPAGAGQPGQPVQPVMQARPGVAVGQPALSAQTLAPPSTLAPAMDTASATQLKQTLLAGGEVGDAEAAPGRDSDFDNPQAIG